MAPSELKLLINKCEQRVLFGEAKRNFIDLLFNIQTVIYKCGICMDITMFSPVSRVCPICSRTMSSVIMAYVPEPDLINTYIVTDEFVVVVVPMSTTSILNAFNKLNINIRGINALKELGALEEKVVDIGMDEVLELLKNALSSNTVLTKVFLGEVDEGVKRYKRPKIEASVFDVFNKLNINTKDIPVSMNTGALEVEIVHVSMSEETGKEIQSAYLKLQSFLRVVIQLKEKRLSSSSKLCAAAAAAEILPKQRRFLLFQSSQMAV